MGRHQHYLAYQPLLAETHHWPRGSESAENPQPPTGSRTSLFNKCARNESGGMGDLSAHEEARRSEASNCYE